MHQYDLTINTTPTVTTLMPRFGYKQIYIPISNKYLHLSRELYKNIMEYDYDLVNKDEYLYIDSSKCYNGNIDRDVPMKSDIVVRCMPIINAGTLLMINEMVNKYESVVLYKDVSSIYSYIKCSHLRSTQLDACIDYFHVIQIEMQYLVNHYTLPYEVVEEEFTPEIAFSKDPIKIYTDGSSIKTKSGKNNGCAVVIPYLGKIYMQHMVDDSTNIKAELQAICNALDIIDSCISDGSQYNVTIYTDSEYSIKAITGEYKNLKENLDWIHYARDRIKSLRGINFSFHFVRAHTKKNDEDSYFNDICDTSAKRAASNT